MRSLLAAFFLGLPASGAITVADLPELELDPDQIQAPLLTAFKLHMEGKHAESAKMFSDLSIEGNARATFLLALCHLGGEGVPLSPGKGTDLLRQSAQAGYAPAQVRVAHLLFARDLKDEALDYLNKAVEARNAEALYASGCLHATGTYLTKDHQKAYTLLKAAADAGHPEAPVALASLLPVPMIEKHKKDLLPALQARVRANQPSAHTAMGHCFALGIMGVPRDPAMAFQMFLKGVKEGHKTAFHDLALCYQHGFGIAQDKKRARSWMIQAALRGEPRAALALSKAASSPVEQLAWSLCADSPELLAVREGMNSETLRTSIDQANRFLAELRKKK
ncbi:MAG: tetratricopeptide repeat protein [Akkermansiaceae bacterium]